MARGWRSVLYHLASASSEEEPDEGFSSGSGSAVVKQRLQTASYDVSAGPPGTRARTPRSHIDDEGHNVSTIAMC